MSPFITVLLPVYNCEKYIAESINSILQQTYVHFELLIIDDCSTDSTLQICKSFQDERIVIIEKEKNSGYTNSLNYGITVAKGKYIARMDGDDISLPTRFEKQVAFLEANEDVVVCGTSYSIMNSNKLSAVPEFHENIKVQLLSGNCIAHPSVMLKKSTLQTNSIFYNTEMEPAEDYDMWTRLISVGKIYNLQESLLQYRVHNNQVSNTRNKIQKQNSTNIKINLLKKLNATISEAELNVYKNIIEQNSIVTSLDFKVYINLKYRLMDFNKGFFNPTLFQEHFLKIENAYIRKNFKNNKEFNFNLFYKYLKIANQTNAKLTTTETIKFFVKCFTFSKV